MFSGLIETTGKITEITKTDALYRVVITPVVIPVSSTVIPAKAGIHPQENIHFCSDLQLGDSIAINGVCLTVIDFNEKNFVVEIVPQTLRCTNLKNSNTNDTVNLERSMKVEQRVGGHFVQGHVDTVSKILSIESDGEAWLVKYSLPKTLALYVIDKGYITIDGMSITVIKANKDDFTVTFIPHTREVTIVKNYQVGTEVNLEVDMLGKYVVKFMENKK